MPIYNFFVPNDYSELADRKEVATVIAAETLVIIIELKAKLMLRRNPEAVIQIEGSCIEDLALYTQGLEQTDLDRLQYFCGVEPRNVGLGERTA